MKKSRLKPKRTTFIQRQKTHPAPTYNSCVQCGMNTDKQITDWDELFYGKPMHPFVVAAIRRFGKVSPKTMVGIKILYFCREKCIEDFIETHKLDILEEITK